MVRKLAIAAVAVVAVLAAAAFIIPGLIPPDVYRAQIETRTSTALGRAVEITGPVRVGVIPSLQARAEAVTIANAEGFGDEPLVQVAELRARLALFPLLARRVEIKEFVLVEPRIALEVDRAGRNNWTFGAAEAGGGAAAGGADGGFTRVPGALPFEAALGDVRIIDGQASYVDRAEGQEHAATDIDLSVRMPSLSAPLHVEGGFALDGDPVRLEAQLDSLRTFFDGLEAPFFAELDAGPLEVEVDGRFEADQAVSFAGDVRIASDDVRALAAKAGASLPEGPVYRRFDLRGHAAGNARRVSFERAELAFDDIKGTGELVANLAGERPALTGSLVLGALDVTPYLPAQGGKTQGGGQGGAGGGGGGTAPWSEEEIDFGPLKALDADLSLTVDSLRAQAFEFGKSDVRARLRDGRLQINISELAAYGGQGAAELVVDASGSTPKVSLVADLANLQAQPFLTAAANFRRLTGVGGGRIEVASQGRSPAAIMQGLDGSGRFGFQDGAIQGVNIAAALRGIDALREGKLDLEAFGSQASTDFTDLGGQFTVTDGVATLSQFQLSSPLLRVTGSGDLNLAEQSVDLRLEPRAVASIQGQGGKSDLSGLGVPLRLSGSWGAVKAGVDEEALERLAARAAVDAALSDDAAGKIDDALGAGASDILRGALGLPGRSGAQAPAAPADESASPPAGKPEDEQAEEEQKKDPAEQLLQDLFGDPD